MNKKKLRNAFKRDINELQSLWKETERRRCLLRSEMLIVQCIWQYHSKSYDNHDAYSSVNGAAICTTQALPDPLPVGLCWVSAV